MSLPQPDMYGDWPEWAAALIKELDTQRSQAPKPETTGKVATFYKTVATGWLECDGSTFPAQSYPALSQLLGGTTLPNLTSAFGVDYKVGIKT